MSWKHQKIIGNLNDAHWVTEVIWREVFVIWWCVSSLRHQWTLAHPFTCPSLRCWKLLVFQQCCLLCCYSCAEWVEQSGWLLCRLNLMKIKNASTATVGFAAPIPVGLNSPICFLHWMLKMFVRSNGVLPPAWFLRNACGYLLCCDAWVGMWKLMDVFIYSGRNKTSSAVSGTQVLAERSSREGSAQRMPRQPSMSHMQKAGTSGKNTGGGNST